jgi:hypothetical protein
MNDPNCLFRRRGNNTASCEFSGRFDLWRRSVAARAAITEVQSDVVPREALGRREFLEQEWREGRRPDGKRYRHRGEYLEVLLRDVRPAENGALTLR